jgi:hypothetical protein
LTAWVYRRESRRVITVKPDRPYFDAWLRRMKRHFAASGRLSQTAVLLAGEYGESPDIWVKRLRALLDGGEPPSLELLTRIDALLAPPVAPRPEEMSQGMLFG